LTLTETTRLKYFASQEKLKKYTILTQTLLSKENGQ